MNREAVLLVLFDLPMETKQNRRDYSHFRNGLKRLGYLMFQKSVYYKMIPNHLKQSAEKNRIETILPAEGDVHFLPIPLRHFLDLSALRGAPFPLENLTSPVLDFE